LRACGALAVVFPEVDALYGVPQRAEFHPEVDTGVHIEMVLDMAARLAPRDDLVAWCALTHDLGKALTPKDELPRHLRHEHNGVAPLRELNARLKVPAEHAAFAGNAIALSDDVVWMSAQADRALGPDSRGALAAAGFEVRSVELDAIEAGGGSLRCCVGEIF
jgi:putative nucleotidyltransferase with HDIG domain